MNRKTAGTCFVLGALIAACLWLSFRESAPRIAASFKDAGESAPWKAAPHRGEPRRSNVSVISGQIRDEAGAPIAAASVCLQNLDRTAWNAARSPACTTSSETGAYRLMSETAAFVQVTASAVEHEPGKHDTPLRAGESYEGIDVVLRSGGARLAGTVVDALGGAVAGATVRVEREIDGLSSGVVEASDLGEFSLSVTPGKRMRVMATADGYTAAQAVWVAPASDVRLVLSPASSIAGRVVLAQSGEPVPGVTVRAHPEDQLTEHEDALAVSDADGNFTIAGVYAGRHQLNVRSERFRSRAADAVDVGLAKHVRDLVVEVDPALVVRGDAVIAKSGQPCASGSVALFDANEAPNALPMRMPRDGAYLRPDGTFELRGVLPGRYLAQADCIDHIAIEQGFEITLEDQDMDGLRFRFEAGKRVRVDAKSADGQPIAGAWVVLQRVPRDPMKRPGWSGLTNSEGWIDLGGLEAGNYEASAVKLPSTPMQQVVLSEADEFAMVALTSAGSAYVTVSVHGERGAVDNRLEVHALPAQGPQDSSYRAPIAGEPLGEGRYELGPLQPGEYEVFVSGPDNPSVPVEGQEGMLVRVRAGERVALDATLRPATGVIRGRVVDAAGVAVRDAWVSARFSGRRPVHLVPEVRHIQGETRRLTDADGRFELDGLDAEASFTVKVERPDDGVTALREGVRAGEDIAIELAPPASTAQTAAIDG